MGAAEFGYQECFSPCAVRSNQLMLIEKEVVIPRNPAGWPLGDAGQSQELFGGDDTGGIVLRQSNSVLR